MYQLYIFNLNFLAHNHSTSKIWFLNWYDIILSLPHNIIIAETGAGPGKPILLSPLTTTAHGLLININKTIKWRIQIIFNGSVRFGYLKSFSIVVKVCEDQEKMVLMFWAAWMQGKAALAQTKLSELQLAWLIYIQVLKFSFEFKTVDSFPIVPSDC